MSGSSGQFDGNGARERTRGHDGDAVLGQHQQPVDIVEVLDHPRRGAPGGLDAAHDPVDRAVGERRPHERTRQDRPAQLLEHDRGIGSAEPVGSQREHTGLGELGERVAVEAGADALHREAALAQAADPVAQRDLVVGEVEVHAICTCGSRGSPSGALADDVALDLGRAGRDRERQRPHPLLDHARRRGRARPGRARFSDSSPSRCRASEYASFIISPPVPGAPGARPATRCACVSAHSASNSAARWPSSRRYTGSAVMAPRSSMSRRDVHELAHERGAPLERERHLRDPPAVVLRADPVLDRHPHVVEEHLAELRRAEHRLDAAAPRCRAGPSAGSAS